MIRWQQEANFPIDDTIKLLELTMKHGMWFSENEQAKVRAESRKQDDPEEKRNRLLQDLFKACDINKDNRLTVTELKKFFDVQGKTYYEGALNEIDADGRKTLNQKEFTDGVIEWQTNQLITLNEALE